MDCEVRIGASGWHYKHWRGPFYDAALPPSKMLAHYVQHFDTVEINTILRAHNAAFSIYDLAGFQTPREITADFTYIRLHGPLGKYQGSYPAEALRAWATRIKTWRRRLKHIDMYFDNDQEAFAVWNALELKKLIPAR